MISYLTNRAALPILASLQAEGRQAELRRVSWLMALGQFAAAAAIAVPLGLAAPWIMGLAGPAFAAQWPVLVLMIATGVVLAAQTSLGNYLLVTDRQVFMLMSLLPWGVVLLACAYLFSASGAYALAWGLLVASVLRTLLILGAYRESRSRA